MTTTTTIRLIGPVALATVVDTLVACGGSEHLNLARSHQFRHQRSREREV